MNNTLTTSIKNFFASTKGKLWSAAVIILTLVVSSFIGNFSLFTGSLTLPPGEYVNVTTPVNTSLTEPLVSYENLVPVTFQASTNTGDFIYDFELINYNDQCQIGDCAGDRLGLVTGADMPDQFQKTIQLDLREAHPINNRDVYKFAFRMLINSSGGEAVISEPFYIQQRSLPYEVRMESAQVVQGEGDYLYEFNSIATKRSDNTPAIASASLKLGSQTYSTTVTPLGNQVNSYSIVSEEFNLLVGRAPLTLEIIDTNGFKVDYNFEVQRYGDLVDCNPYHSESPKSQSSQDCYSNTYAPSISVVSQTLEETNESANYKITAQYGAVNGLKTIGSERNENRLQVVNPDLETDSDGDRYYQREYSYTFTVPVTESGTYQIDLFAIDRLNNESVRTVTYSVELTEDRDHDSIPDLQDNCPDTPNTGQQDSDNDGKGDVCDSTPNGPVNPPQDQNCVEAGGSLGAAVPDNDLACCEGLVQTIPFELPGSRGICTDPNNPDLDYAQAVEFVEKAETVFAEALSAGDVEIDAFQQTVAVYTLADNAVNNLANSIQKTALRNRLEALSKQVATHTQIISDFKNLEEEASVENISEIAAQNLLLKLLVQEAKAEQLPESNLRDNLLDQMETVKELLFEIIASKPGTGEVVTMDLSYPLKPAFALTKPSTRTVLNLYRKVGSNVEFVDFIDQNLGSVLLPGTYQCAVGIGCQFELQPRPIRLEPGTYFYRLQVDVEGERLTLESTSFQLERLFEFFPPHIGSINFVDVDPLSPLYPSIKFASDIGLMTGSVLPDGSAIFRPSEVMLRTEVFTISNRLAGITRVCPPFIPEVHGNLGFSDLDPVVFDPAARWYLQEIKCSRDFGSTIVQGYSDGTVKALNKSTWAEAVKVLLESSRVGRVTNGILPVFNTNLQPWWSNYYQFVNSRNIVIPDGLRNITRGQFAQLIYALYQKGVLNAELIQNNV